jgi:hypothetical protein
MISFATWIARNCGLHAKHALASRKGRLWLPAMAYLTSVTGSKLARG